MFTPIQTERLLIRGFTPDDADALAQRRNDPAVAEYQDWLLPFTDEQARQVANEVAALGGPTPGHWWMAAVCDPTSGEVFGDLALHLDADGHTAEVGYTFARQHWGNGYAVEALEWLVSYVFDELGVTRAEGKLHPDNPASAQLLERTGFVFEGHTRSSFWLGDECSDDWIYGQTREDRERWTNRLRTPPEDLRLVKITPDTVYKVARLTTHKTQERFVSPVRVSYGDALFPEVIDGAPVVPWLRAIEADGDLVGFVMLAARTPHHPEPYLWRFLVDRLHQRRGIGHRVLDLIADECRADGATTLLTSWEPGRGTPEPFYLAHGFVPTGQIVDGEIEARWTLDG